MNLKLFLSGIYISKYGEIDEVSILEVNDELKSNRNISSLIELIILELSVLEYVSTVEINDEVN